MSTEFDIDPRRNKILIAALAVFARYGFKRVSMADVALEAGVSRPALYVVFPNKAAIFEALAHAMANKICTEARSAWGNGMTFSDGLAAAGKALHLDAWRLLKGSPHGGELVSSNTTVVGEITVNVDARFAILVAERLQAAGQTSADARLIVSSLAGIKDKARNELELVEGIERMSKLIAQGLGLTS
jgi:AcrR family transcriptional regulator